MRGLQQNHIVFLGAIVVSVVVLSVFFVYADNPVNTSPERQGVLIQPSRSTDYLPVPAKMSEIQPNSMHFFVYPVPEKASSYSLQELRQDQNKRQQVKQIYEKQVDAYQRFILIRLPEWLGGDKDDVSSFRAYSAIDLTPGHCLIKYWPSEGRQRIEDPCSGTMYRAFDGLHLRGFDLLSDPLVALPDLPLETDEKGHLYVGPSLKWSKTENGIIAEGREVTRSQAIQSSKDMLEEFGKSVENPSNIPFKIGQIELLNINKFSDYWRFFYSDPLQRSFHATLLAKKCDDCQYSLSSAAFEAAKKRGEKEIWLIGDSPVIVPASSIDGQKRHHGSATFTKDGYKYKIRTSSSFDLIGFIAEEFFSSQNEMDSPKIRKSSLGKIPKNGLQDIVRQSEIFNAIKESKYSNDANTDYPVISVNVQENVAAIETSIIENKTEKKIEVTLFVEPVSHDIVLGESSCRFVSGVHGLRIVEYADMETVKDLLEFLEKPTCESHLQKKIRT